MKRVILTLLRGEHFLIVRYIIEWRQPQTNYFQIQFRVAQEDSLLQHYIRPHGDDSQLP